MTTQRRPLPIHPPLSIFQALPTHASNEQFFADIELVAASMETDHLKNNGWMWNRINVELMKYVASGLLNLEELQTNLKTDLWIAGGFLRDIVAGKTPKDLDLWTADRTAAEKLVRMLSGYRYKETYRGPVDYRVDFFEVWKLARWTWNGKIRRIDVIATTTSVANPASCIAAFDYTVNAIALDIGSLDLYYHPRTHRDIASRLLWPVMNPKESEEKRMERIGVARKEHMMDIGFIPTPTNKIQAF